MGGLPTKPALILSFSQGEKETLIPQALYRFLTLGHPGKQDGGWLLRWHVGKFASWIIIQEGRNVLRPYRGVVLRFDLLDNQLLHPRNFMQ